MTTALLCYSTLTSSLWKQNSKESYALCSWFEVFPSWDLKYIMVVLVKIKNSSNCITQETNVYKCSALCQCSSQHHQQSTGSPCDVVGVVSVCSLFWALQEHSKCFSPYFFSFSTSCLSCWTSCCAACSSGSKSTNNTVYVPFQKVPCSVFSWLSSKWQYCSRWWTKSVNV